MKKKLVIISLLMILATISIAYGEVSTGANLEVTLISQEPDPVNPGEVMDLRFKVENIGSDAVDDVILEFIEDYPFTVYTKETQQNIGSLQGRQKDEEGVIVLYKIKIDENAVQGTFYADIRYKIGSISSKWYTIKDFPIRIRTRDIVLSIEEVTSKPELISPGDDLTLSLELKNNADSLIRDITVKLDLSSADIPFAPSSSTAEKQIYQINSKTGKVMEFDLLALPDADGGIYKVPINISYTDETGASYSRQDIISLKVSSPPDLLVNIDSSQVKGDVKTGEVAIKITNRGLTDIKLLSAELKKSDDIDILSESEIYVGNIDSDDYETVDFMITVRSYEKSVTLPLVITYKDSTNKEFTQEIDLELKTNSPTKTQTTVKGIINGIITLVIIVIVGLIIYKIYKRIKRRKKRQG